MTPQEKKGAKEALTLLAGWLRRYDTGRNCTDLRGRTMVSRIEILDEIDRRTQELKQSE